MNNDDEHGPIKNESACNYDEEKGTKTPPNASEPLTLEGTDNYGRPRQLFADKLAAATTTGCVTLATTKLGGEASQNCTRRLTNGPLEQSD